MFENTRAALNSIDRQSLTVGIELRDQSMPYMFEVVDANGMPTSQYVLPISPEQYRISHTPRTTQTATQGGIYTDNAGTTMIPISLQGVFGYLGNYPGGNGQTLDAGYRDGWGLAMQCEETILNFYQQFLYIQKMDPLKAPTLRFYNYTDKDYFVVEINKFDLHKNKNRKLLYQYDIQMMAVARLSDGNPAVRNMFSRPLPEFNANFGMWAQILEQIDRAVTIGQAVIQDVHEINGKIVQIAQAVKDFRQGLTDFIVAPFQLVQETINAVDQVVDAVIGFSEIPHEFSNELRKTKRALLELRQMPEKFKNPDTVEKSTAAERSAVTEIMTAAIPGFTDEATVEMDIPEVTIFKATDKPAELSIKAEPIKGTDTIETIAARTLGSADNWSRLAVLNGLESPYISMNPMDKFTPAKGVDTADALIPIGTSEILLSGITPQPGEILILGDPTQTATVEKVLANGYVALTEPLLSDVQPGTIITLHERTKAVMGLGDKLLVPSEQTVVASIAASQNTDIDARLFGTDEALDADGNHLVDSTGSIATVSGLENLQMQLQHRLRTLKGEISRHPEYGSYLPRIIGKVGVNYWYERAILEAEMTAKDDPRIQSVQNTTLQAQGTAIFLEADVVPVNQTTALHMSIQVN